VLVGVCEASAGSLPVAVTDAHDVQADPVYER
jgi:hypothetical protein